MSQAFCTSCGAKWNPEDKICPECGNSHKVGESYSAGTRSLTMLSGQLIPAGKRKKDYVFLSKSGKKISGKTHHLAREQLVIDRLKHRKYHHVEELDESGQWKTKHHEDVPLGEKKKKTR
jgi:hypothetical protein